MTKKRKIPTEEEFERASKLSAERNNIKPDLLIKAVLMWTGWQKEDIPRRNDSLFLTQFEAESAKKILKTIHLLEKDFYQSNAKFIANDLNEMNELSIKDFKKKYPNLPKEISNAFAWCYTYDFK